MPVVQKPLDAPRDDATPKPVYPARPNASQTPDYQTLRAEIMTRFRKTLAYLAK
jgi:hypothetical protein